LISSSLRVGNHTPVRRFISERRTPTKEQKQSVCNNEQLGPIPAPRARELAIDIPRHFQRNPQMMKIQIAVIATTVSFATAVGCFAASPQMGTWKLNEAKSKIPAGMGKNNTVTYADQKDKIKITVDGTDKNGKPTHSVWMGKFDGKAYPVKGNLSYNAVAYRTVNDRTNDITALKDGKVMWSGRITVAPDGKSRTVTINGTEANGKKFSGKAVYNKG
jgi:hypothetical protein